MGKLRLHSVIFVAFALLWVLVVFVDYLDKNEVYEQSITFYKYYFLTFFFLFTSTLLSLYYNKVGFLNFKRPPFLSGLVILGVILIYLVGTTIAFNSY